MLIVSGPYQRFSIGLGQIVSHVSNDSASEVTTVWRYRNSIIIIIIIIIIICPTTELTQSEEQFVAYIESKSRR